LEMVRRKVKDAIGNNKNPSRKRKKEEKIRRWSGGVGKPK